MVLVDMFPDILANGMLLTVNYKMEQLRYPCGKVTKIKKIKLL